MLAFDHILQSLTSLDPFVGSLATAGSAPARPLLDAEGYPLAVRERLGW